MHMNTNDPDCRHSSPLFEALYKLPRYYKSLDLGCSFINLKYLGISHQFLHRIFCVEPSTSKYLSNNTKYIEVEACDRYRLQHLCGWPPMSILSRCHIIPQWQRQTRSRARAHTQHICSELTWMVTQKRSKWPNDKIGTTSEPPQDLTNIFKKHDKMNQAKVGMEVGQQGIRRKKLGVHTMWGRNMCATTMTAGLRQNILPTDDWVSA